MIDMKNMLHSIQHAQLWLYRIEKETHSNYHSSRCRKWFTCNINLNSSFSTFGWLRNTSKKMPNNKFIYSLKENKQNKMQRLKLQKEYYIYNNIYAHVFDKNWQICDSIWAYMVVLTPWRFPSWELCWMNGWMGFVIMSSTTRVSPKPCFWVQ